MTFTRTAPSESASHPRRFSDPRRLRGLAHPLRMRLRTELIEHGPATASQLAARTGESSGATSYHLRQLAAYGFVVEDLERGHGRERYWQVAEHQATATSPSQEHTSVEQDAISPTVPGEWPADVEAEVASSAASVELAWSDPWERCEWFLDMTTDESDELSRKFHELCVPYTSGRRERPEGAHRVSVQFLLRRDGEA